jgi:hypothetical protein
MRSTLLFVGLLASGCVTMTGSDSSSVDDDGDPGERASCSGDRDACKIEGSQIGQEGLVLALDSGSVTFHDWVGKPDSPGEYIGFSLTVEGDRAIRYFVKSGTGIYPSTTLTWMHPGSDCKGISNVDFPDDDTDPCDNPDGCPDDDDGGDGPIL